MEHIDIDKLPLSVSLVGVTVRDSWECFEWRVTITSSVGVWAFPYYCGMGHIEVKKGSVPMPSPAYKTGTIAYEAWHKQRHQPKKPCNSSILHSLLMDSEAGSMSFKDWCDSFGYSSDSIKAFDTYRACCETEINLIKHLGREAIAALRTQLEDF